MPESYTQVPANSTGVKIGGQARTVGSDTVLYQRFIDTVDRVTTAKVWATSFRIPQAAATTQNLFSVYNANTSGPFCGIRRLSVEIESATAVTAVAPLLRLYRVAGTAHTGGGTLTKVAQDTADTQNANITAMCGASADNTASAMTVGTISGTAAWAQSVPRWATLAGYGAIPSMQMIPDDGGMHRDDPFYLRYGQGIVVRSEIGTAPTAGTWTYVFKVVWGEFTTP